MTLSTRLTVAMVGLVLLTGSALGVVTFRHVEMSTLVSEATAVLSILLLIIPLARAFGRPMVDSIEECMRGTSSPGPITATEEFGIIARTFDRMTTEMRDKTVLRRQSEQRRNNHATTADITRRSQAEEMFRLVVEAYPSGVVIVDRSGKLVMVNTEIEHIFGYGRDELIGQSVDILMPKRVRSQHGRYREAFTVRPETRRMGAGRDIFGLRKDGTEFPIEVGLNAIRADPSLLIVGVILDITERKRLDGLKDEFVATVSHELRTPLTSISGALGLLMGKAAGNLPDPVARLIGIAHTNSQRLARLVNDILDIEKMESGRVFFNLGRVEARPLVEQAIEDNRALAEGNDVRIRLGEACTVGDVRADSDRLAQVVTNLLSNAIKFSPAKSEVVVTIEKKAAVVRISVRDHGPGISADFKPHIFERFAQADAVNARRKGGSGLGLSIVKQIVDRLGGEVGFVDAAGGGTIFYVALPSWDRVAGMAIDLDARPDAVRLLLCEDDPDMAVVLREQLSQVGLATDFAYTVGDAITCAAATRYCIFLVDLQLPDGDGIDLILRLRQLPQYRDTPVVVVSADPGRGRDDARSPELNVLDWLQKPVDFDRLRLVLTKRVPQDASGRRPSGATAYYAP